MTNHEQAGADHQPENPTGLRNFWKRIKRSGEIADVPAVVPPPDPGESYLDIHRGKVAAQMLNFFNAVDAYVGEAIGYEGNIREELQARIPPLGLHEHSFNAKGLDPALQEYINGSNFYFPQHGENGDLAGSYKIAFRYPLFSPTVYVKTHDGDVWANLLLGPNRDEFEHVQFRRVFNNGRVRHVGTFTPHSVNPDNPPHPVEITHSTIRNPRSYVNVQYDNIDAAGNVTLLDGQTLGAPSGNSVGRYSAVDHSISPIIGKTFPYTREDDYLLIGSGRDEVCVPLQTNIYNELNDITAMMRTITP